MATEKFSITIIFVNYKTSKLIDACLKSLTSQSFLNFNIVIVDNSPNNFDILELESLKIKFKDIFEISIFKPKFNLGFAGGNNYAIRRVKTKYTFLLNCDTEIDDPDCLSKIYEYMEAHKNVAMLSPKMKIFSNPNIIWYAGAKINPSNFYLSYHIGENRKDSGQFDKTIDTDYSVGAALFFRTEITNKIGFLDEIFFMYWEETDWNLTAKQNGYIIKYFPKTTVLHKVRINSVNNKENERVNLFQLYLYTRNMIILHFKHYSLLKILIFLPRQLIKKTLIQLRVAMKNSEYKIILTQIRAIYNGIYIGFNRKMYRSCRKKMVEEYKFLNTIPKISRSLQ
ncbi:hypothetical protein NEF87_004348 [Candidatus Lokiarchaeum ossiferum]|uniref:Glycosyltransferase 2-like domain-containing protein n=1 Tax=Candidatus Lokiarchaeum ossiferum TaxID=2951803 RepID=A0ABY6HXG1_9ARCH|nr:hypothetical protein NEF87_004348 [Candidatus Lokiarchaeum sp. B-35]